MYWTSYEDNIAGRYDEGLMQAMYETVDKDEYPSFADWLWDMERSGTFYRHNGRTVIYPRERSIA